MKAPALLVSLLSAVLCCAMPAPPAVADDIAASREATVGGLRVVLLSVSREVVLTGEKGPDKATRHRLRVTYLVERLEEPKKSGELSLGELQVFLAGTEKRAEEEANSVHVKAYPLDKYPYADRVTLPKVKTKEWATVYELDREPLKKIERKAVDIRIKGIGLGDNRGTCEFRSVPLE